MKNLPWWARVLLVTAALPFVVLAFLAAERKDGFWFFAHFLIQWILLGMATGFFASCKPGKKQ